MIVYRTLVVRTNGWGNYLTFAEEIAILPPVAEMDPLTALLFFPEWNDPAPDELRSKTDCRRKA
jgi:hypothetical protein